MINGTITFQARTMEAACDAVLKAMYLIEEGDISGHGRDRDGNFSFEVTDIEPS